MSIDLFHAITDASECENICSNIAPLFKESRFLMFFWALQCATLVVKFQFGLCKSEMKIEMELAYAESLITEAYSLYQFLEQYIQNEYIQSLKLHKIYAYYILVAAANNDFTLDDILW